MNQAELKEYAIKHSIGIEGDYGRVLAMVDFANVNYWFDEDRQSADYTALAEDEKLAINLEGLKEFLLAFCDDVRFYYGHDPKKEKSMAFLRATKHIFGKKRVFTKPLQMVRHYLDQDEALSNTRITYKDAKGDYILLPKCNFDVEISVDAIRLSGNYEALVLLSGDSDFVSLLRFLRSEKKEDKGKKTILIKGGEITKDLRDSCDKLINAQQIKSYITKIKKLEIQKPGV